MSGSDCLCQFDIYGETTKIGYVKVWGCPTTAMWVYKRNRKGKKNAIHRR